MCIVFGNLLKLLIIVSELQVILQSMHVAFWDSTLGFDEQFNCFTVYLELTVDQLLVTSMLVALLELKVECNFLKILSDCELRRLLNVTDTVLLVDLLQIDQWNSLVCIYIDIEDLVP